MGINKNFPKSPFQILNPDIRWFPGDENLGEKGRDKLLAPLVNKIRKEVFEWRNKNYSNISETSKSLLEYWFKTPHANNFRYYFAQRESVETIIYLYESAKIENPTDLIKYDSSGVILPSMFEEQWLRLVIKQATGTGKTKVLSLLIAWCYFNKLYEKNSNLSKNFLLIAPNTIVLDRLRTDIEDLKIYNQDPIIPPNNYDGKSWKNDFKLKVHIQDDIHSLSEDGNLFLTNIQRFSERKKTLKNKGYLKNYFLGEQPAVKNSQNKIFVRDVVNELNDIVVMNDEAHHIHDSTMSWSKTIENINNNLIQKGKKIGIQIDVTATPRHQNGDIFIQTVSDYPLVEAIAQEVVKKPVLPDEASRGKLSEKTSTKYSERFRDYINLGVTVWHQDYEKHKKLGKKALLFVMVDDTKDCDDVKQYLENTFPLLKGSTFAIHTNKEGRIDEGVSSKSQNDLKELRELSNKVDSDENDIKAVVSVLMLKEGWDVKNVTTIIGLRPYSSKSNILPEQTLGRGLRRMYFGENVSEELSVVGTEKFLDFVESIKSEGVVLEKRSMGKTSEPSGPTIIEVDSKKDLKKLEIEIPILTPRIQRNYTNLNELDSKKFDFKPFKIKKFSEEDQKNFVFRYMLEGEVAYEIKVNDELMINSSSIVSFFTKSIMNEMRLFGGQEILYLKVKEFMQEVLFIEKVDLGNANIARNLSETDIRRSIIDIFKYHINKLTVSDKGTSEIVDYIKVSQTKTFSVPRTTEYLLAKKSIFNKIVGDSNFELKFSGFLDATTDVRSHIKNFKQLNFKIDYIKSDGSIGNYYPDFTIKLNNGNMWVVETKGPENIDDPRKIKRLKSWCENASELTGKNWDYLYVKQEIWDQIKITPNTFNEIINVFKNTQ
tara:strand:+ start:60 stop:2708 length:2649 start_codon:yes stop_codon:yes gene_type:complete